MAFGSLDENIHIEFCVKLKLANRRHGAIALQKEKTPSTRNRYAIMSFY